VQYAGQKSTKADYQQQAQGIVADFSHKLLTRD
jgi:hypothetical protein